MGFPSNVWKKVQNWAKNFFSGQKWGKCVRRAWDAWQKGQLRESHAECVTIGRSAYMLIVLVPLTYLLYYSLAPHSIVVLMPLSSLLRGQESDLKRKGFVACVINDDTTLPKTLQTYLLMSPETYIDSFVENLSTDQKQQICGTCIDASHCVI